MNRFLVLVILLSIALSFGQSDTGRGTILALENAWNQAEQRQDVKALDGLLAATFSYTDVDGSFMNRSQFLASVKNSPFQAEQIANETMEVSIYGTAAVVTGLYREKGTNRGKPYLRRGRFTDTWISENGTWRCVASQSTLIAK